MTAPLFRGQWLVSIQQITRGFLFIPSVIALSGVALAIAAVWLDRRPFFESAVETFVFLNIGADGARAVLGTIAGAMMTIISLVYSLTLIVFVLAASNIGPRLLETFANNRINQVTIGLLGATFLYALIVLYIVGDQEVPRVSVAIAIGLAAVSFFWVVFFVHDVARRIMVDNEIGRTQRSLRKAIDRLLAAEPQQEADDRKAIPASKPSPIKAERSGYVIAVDTAVLVELARENDGFIELLVPPGSFVIESAEIARVYGGAANCDRKRLTKAILLADARAPEGDIRFNIHLIVEIALRALSPGINDAYTAISAIDHLSGSLARILQRGAPSALTCDAHGEPRLWMELIGVEDIVGVALHPLRRAAGGHALVTLRLIDAIARIREVAPASQTYVLHKHLRLIAQDCKSDIHNRDDRREIAQALRRARNGLSTDAQY